MTPLLQQAITAISLLPPQEQDEVAARLLAKLDEDDDFDRAIAASAHKLARLAEGAIAESRAGLTEDLDPEAM